MTAILLATILQLASHCIYFPIGLEVASVGLFCRKIDSVEVDLWSYQRTYVLCDICITYMFIYAYICSHVNHVFDASFLTNVPKTHPLLTLDSVWAYFVGEF